MNNLLSVAFYKGGHAYYKLSTENGKLYRAELIDYKGMQKEKLPDVLFLVKDGNGFLANSDYAELAEELLEVVDANKYYDNSRTNAF